ncbi:hypothetical protein SAMN04488587_0441 [Methanococcoides vulcani]|uniref:Uncharacterized protein n=1 Tax=Methanococcoides vulcani TaxID=1353158 RepID=A0A1H9YCL0_9EURY|nr:hypothetical protein SAMN04488587_0441 [Methanococcoides vulcani]
MQHKSSDRPNLADRLFFILTQPENLARILRWAWIVSLGMLVLGYLLIYFNLKSYINL